MDFKFQLMMTEQCNLECAYCYIDQKGSNMTKQMFMKHYKMLPRMMKKYNTEKYEVVFFGGEPLLNWELMEYIIPIFKVDPRCSRIILITNGLLLDKEKMQYLKIQKVDISLSFDGLWNKVNRPLKGGGSSFGRYLEYDLREIFKNKSCKVMVSPANVKTLVDNFKWFVEKYNMNQPDFSLVRDDSWNDKDVELFDIKCKELADQVIKYYKQGISANVGLFKLFSLDMIFGKVYGKRKFGCWAGNRGAAFFPSGEIYPCGRFGSNEELLLGNSKFDILYNTIEILNKPKIIDPSTFKECRQCEIYQYCNGGCLYNQINSFKPRFLKQSSPLKNICKLLKICYRETIRITHELKDNKLYKDSLINTIKGAG